MSLPAPTRDVSPDDKQHSAPAILMNRETTTNRKPTPDMLPSKLRERFTYTPGLYAFMNRILNLSVISQKSPEELAQSFFDRYDSIVQKGLKYPALRAFNGLTSS